MPPDPRFVDLTLNVFQVVLLCGSNSVMALLSNIGRRAHLCFPLNLSHMFLYNGHVVLI